MLWGLGVLVFPFAVMPWLIPGLSPWTISQDYPVYSIQNQLELLFALRHGTFPPSCPASPAPSPAASLCWDCSPPWPRVSRPPHSLASEIRKTQFSLPPATDCNSSTSAGR